MKIDPRKAGKICWPMCLGVVKMAQAGLFASFILGMTVDAGAVTLLLDNCEAGTGLDQGKRAIATYYSSEDPSIKHRIEVQSDATTRWCPQALDLEEVQISAAKKAVAVRAAKSAKARADWAARPKGVSIGMTKEQVIATQWGRPSSVNKTTTAAGTREQWVYEGNNYLYFDNGILTAIQN